MRKILFVLSSCILCNVAFGKDTCETRVDAHPTATTLQRIAYCLNEQAVPATADSNAGLVFSKVSAKPAASATKPAQKPTSQEGYFKEDQILVSQDYVATSQFPQLTQQTNDYAQIKAPVEHQMVDEVKVSVVQTSVNRENTKGIKARQTKPARYWKSAPVPADIPAAQPVEPVVPAEDPMPVEEVVSSTTVAPLPAVENMYEELPQQPAMPEPAQAQ